MESRVHTLIVKSVALIALLFMAACSDADAPRAPLVLMGDSIAAQWDADAYFPALAPLDLGIPGAGVESLRQFAGTRAGDTVVMIIGTNDLSSVTDANIDGYVERYAGHIAALGADRVLLFSILPRRAEPIDGIDRNPLITRLNAAIRERCATVPTITYIDAFPAFMHDGSPMEHLYNDHVHLSPDGYEVLAGLLRPYL